MKTSDFVFNIPNNLIAQRPYYERGKSRLLVINNCSKLEFNSTRSEAGFYTMEHRIFEDIVNIIEPGDMIIMNDTKVDPVRLKGEDTNGRQVNFILTKKTGENRYQILSKGRCTDRIRISTELEAEMINGKEAIFHYEGDFNSLLKETGKMPLPPYIKREPDQNDSKWYQTVYAEREGSIAAPTAGLHFTHSILNSLINKGVIIKKITLHVGTGTFKPIKANEVERHKMEEEHFCIDSEVIKRIKEVKESGKRVFLIGTTTTRAIEAYMSGRYTMLNGSNGYINATTDLLIYPKYSFKVADAILTNFHLPATTPLLLVSAFAGREIILKAYKEAIRREYRFLSYGDAMLILR